MNTKAKRLYARKKATAKTRVRAGVGILIRDRRGRILLEKRADCGLWGFPGGRIEPGESITETAVREAKEETGLNVRVKRLIGVYSEIADRILTYHDNIVQLVDIVVEAEILSGKLACSHESERLQFFAPKDLPPKKLLAPPARGPIKDILKKRTGIIR